MHPEVPREAAAEVEGLSPEIAEAFRDRARPPRRSSEDLLGRHRRILAVLAVLLVVFVSGALWGPSLPLPAFVGSEALVLTAMGLDLLFLNLNWSCPRCGRYLGANLARLGWGRTAPRCTHCGWVVR